MAIYRRSALHAVILVVATAVDAQGLVVLGPTEAGSGPSSEFGAALTQGKKYLFVGAPLLDGYGSTDRGIVSLYDVRGYTPIGEVAGSSGPERFGTALAASKDIIYVGGPGGEVSGGGAAGRVTYFNERFTTSGLITNPAPDNGDNFGAAVAASPKLLVIGAPQDIDGENKVMSGAAFVATRKNPGALHRLPMPSYNDGDEVGKAVAVSKHWIAVGAPGTPVNETDNSGAVHIFDATTWSYVLTLTNHDFFSASRFGSSLAFSGNYLLVGAPSARYRLTGISWLSGAGEVLQYDSRTWELVRAYQSRNPQADANFGAAVAGDRKFLVVGVPGFDAGASDRGRAEIFDIRTGTFRQALSSPLTSGDWFYGKSVAIMKGNRIAVGAPATGSAISNRGRVFIHTLEK